MRVQLRALGGGLPAPEAALPEKTGKLAFELTAVVGQQRARCMGHQGQAPIESAGGVSGVLGRGKGYGLSYPTKTRARAVCPACLEGSATAKAKCESAGGVSGVLGRERHGEGEVQDRVDTGDDGAKVTMERR